MQADENVENAVLDLLDQYVQAYHDKNVDMMMDIFIDGDELVAIGTGPDEWVNGSEELRAGFGRDMEQCEIVELTFSDHNIAANGKVAWLSCNLNMEAQIEDETQGLEGRFSAVFEEVDGKWLFSQLHYSLPASEQKEGQSWPES